LLVCICPQVSADILFYPEKSVFISIKSAYYFTK
jgi:hypothetical protein